MDYCFQNELPKTIKRYKAYTDLFQDCLLQTAIQRDYEHAAQLASQAKKKKSKNKRGYQISVEEQVQLVNAIAETKKSLRDTTGLRDLDDAIRSRKEITQYHKINKTIDAGHAFFKTRKRAQPPPKRKSGDKPLT
jgi:alpha-mannosidase